MGRQSSLYIPVKVSGYLQGHEGCRKATKVGRIIAFNRTTVGYSLDIKYICNQNVCKLRKRDTKIITEKNNISDYISDYLECQ